MADMPSIDESQWLEKIQRAPLGVLEGEIARLKQLGAYGADEENLFGSLIEARAAENVAEAAAQEGPENFLRWTARKIEAGEIPESFVDEVLFPVYAEKAREPYKTWGASEAQAIVEAAPEVLGDLWKGVKGLAKYGPAAAAGAIQEGFGGPGTLLGGTGVATPEQKQATELAGTAIEQGTRETYRIGQRLARLLFDSQEDFTEEGLKKRLKADLAYARRTDKVERGERDVGFIESLRWDKDSYEKWRAAMQAESDLRQQAGKSALIVPVPWDQYVQAQKGRRAELTEEQKGYIQPIGEFADLSNFIPVSLGAKAAGKASTVAARTLGKTAEGAGVSAIREAAGTAVEQAGRRAEQALEKPAVRAVSTAAVAAAGGADPTGIVLATLLSGNAAAKRVLRTGPGAVQAVGRAIKTPIRGPLRTFEETVKNAGAGAFYGAAGMLPLAVAGETAEERGSLIAGGAAFGAAGALGQQGVNAFSNFGRSYWTPKEGKPAERAAATSYGTDFDAAHAAATEKLDDAQFNRVEGLRAFVSGLSTPESPVRLYVLPSEQFDALQIPGVKKAQGVYATTGAEKNIFIREGSSSLNHEVGHALEAALSEPERQELRKAVAQAYTIDELEQMREGYREKSGIQLDDTALFEEIIAENAQAALNGLPLGKLGTPSTFSERIYSTIAGLGERLGLRQMAPGGQVVTSEALPWTPSFIVGEAIKNAIAARQLDSVRPEEAQTVADAVATAAAEQAAVEAAPVETMEGMRPVTPRSVDVGALAPVPAELTVDPQSPFNPPGVTGEAGLTPEAEALIEKIDAGGAAPTFISKRLEQIADENGISIQGSTPQQVVEQLRAKRARSGAGPAARPAAAAPTPSPTSAPTPAPAAVQVTPKPATAPVAPAAAPSTNVRGVTETARAPFKGPTPEVLRANQQTLADELAKPFAERVPLETDYFAAIDTDNNPKKLTQPQREAQRRLAEAADKLGYKNPLRQLYNKVFIPISSRGTNTLFGFSADKLIQNLDLLAGWAEKNPSRGAIGTTYKSLDDPAIPQDIQTYLRNQANGYSGAGASIVRPAGIDPARFPAENKAYTPVKLPKANADFINFLMGLEGVSSEPVSVAGQFVLDLAKLNGIPVATQTPGVPGRGPKTEFNPLSEAYRKAGFDPVLLNQVVEQLRVDRMGTPVRRRDDLQIRAGVQGMIQARLMPSDPAAPVQQEPTRGRFANPAVRQVADEYLREAGLPVEPHGAAIPVNVDLAKRIADFYEQALNEPSRTDVKAAYDSLADQTMAQYRAMEKAGIRIEPWLEAGQPYTDSADMMRDVRDNKRIYFFLTESGFGTNAPASPDNAMLRDSGVEISGKKLLVNDIFRAVHDYFGHSMNGYEFGPKGEFNAYLEHSRMFTPEAKPALAAETLAQNSWVNYGPHLRREDGTVPKKGEEGFVPQSERPFADQKNTVVPQELLDETDAYAREQTSKFMPAFEEAEVNRANPFRGSGIYSGWLLKNGQFKWANSIASHEDLARYLGFKNIEDLRDNNGAVRVWADGSDKVLTFGVDTFQELPRIQRSAIEDLAIEQSAAIRDDRGNVIEDYRDSAQFMPSEDTQTVGRQVFESLSFMPAGKTDSPEFKKWFGDWEDPKAFTTRAKGPVSMVVSRQGGKTVPAVVYHGTNANFTEFRKTGTGVVDFGFLGAYDTERTGIFFTEDPEAASTFANRENGNVIPAYLDIKSPADFRTPDSIYEVLEEAGRYGRVAFSAGFEPWTLFDGEGGKELVSKLQEIGYDGVMMDEYMRDLGRSVPVWVAFEPSQIKSAIGNRGTFDAANPDIRFMPLKDTKFADEKTQYKSAKKKGSLGGAQDLVHFSSVALKVLDPKTASGKGAATPADLRGLPRGYFYRVGKSAYETGIAERSNVYIAKVDGNSIYDLEGSDPLGWYSEPNKEKADQKLRNAGFVGMRGKPGAIDIVAMFEPVKLTPASTEDVYSKKQLAAQRREKAKTQEPERDYQAEYENWKPPAPFRLMPEEISSEGTVPFDQIKAQFMPAPRVDLEDFEGRDVVTLTTDRLGIGKTFVGPTGAERELPTIAQGGRGYPLLYDGKGWAFSDQASAGRFMSRLRKEADKTGDKSVLVATSVLSELNLLKSPYGQAGYAAAYRQAVDSGLLSKKAVDRMFREVFSRAADSANITSKDDKKLLKSVRSLEDFEKAAQEKKLNFNVITPVLERLDARTLSIPFGERKEMGLDALSVARSMADPELVELPDYSLVSLMEIPVNQTPEKDDQHFSYPWSVKGKLVGFFNTPYQLQRLADDPRIRNRSGAITTQPVQVVMPSLTGLKVSEQNPVPRDTLRAARVERNQ